MCVRAMAMALGTETKSIFSDAPVKRTIQSRKKHTDRKPYYDEKDKEALKLMRKLRVDWSDQEDSFLLICKGSVTCDVHLGAGRGYLNSRGSHP